MTEPVAHGDFIERVGEDGARGRRAGGLVAGSLLVGTVVALGASGCAATGAATAKRAHPRAGAAVSPDSPEALWAMAPPGTWMGIVVATNELEMNTVVGAERVAKRAPGGESIASLLTWILDSEPYDARSPRARVAAGEDEAAPVGMFWAGRGFVTVGRVADPKLARRAFKMKPVPGSGDRLFADAKGMICGYRGRMAICGGNRDVILDVLHRRSRSMRWPARFRGNVEMWVAPEHLGPLAGLVRGGAGLYVAADLARGRMAVRAPVRSPDGVPGAPG